MKKLQVATVTFNGAANYGARLQTYALQRIIKSLGHDSKVLNFDYPLINFQYEPFRWKMLAQPRALIHVPWNFIPVSRRNQRFKEFTRRYIRETRPLRTRKELAQVGNDYDVIVTGSDQVFNGTLHGHCSEYFLSFSTPEKNISYAGSFGFKKVPSGEEDWYRKNLACLGQISCREETGARLVKELTGRKATVDLDPVLLLNGKEWKNSLAGEGNHYMIPNEYIFTYMMNPHIAGQVTKYLKIPLVNIQSSKPLRNKVPGQNIYDAGPSEFINLLLGARYVLTGSFHATVFSLLLHKPFLTVVPAGVGSRITDLLYGLNLENHIWKEGTRKIPDANWEQIDLILEKRRKNSIEHLQHMILQAAGKGGSYGG